MGTLERRSISKLTPELPVSLNPGTTPLYLRLGDLEAEEVPLLLLDGLTHGTKKSGRSAIYKFPVGKVRTVTLSISPLGTIGIDTSLTPQAVFIGRRPVDQNGQVVMQIIESRSISFLPPVGVRDDSLERIIRFTDTHAAWQTVRG